MEVHGNKLSFLGILPCRWDIGGRLSFLEPGGTTAHKPWGHPEMHTGILHRGILFVIPWQQTCYRDNYDLT